MPKNATWELKPHTWAKHQILSKYLAAWFPIMAQTTGRIVYIDGFSGPGVYAAGERGSPIIALSVLLDHALFSRWSQKQFVFLFVEKDRACFTQLEAELERFWASRPGGQPENVVVHTRNEEFSKAATDVLEQLNGKELAPTFAFIDPFGYKDIPMSLISRLMSFNRTELLVYFDYNSAERFATAGNVDHLFDEWYGTSAYRDAPAAGHPDRHAYLRDLYATQLATVCGFNFVRHFQMIKSTGRTNNYLFYGTNHTTGLSRMKDSMWAMDPLGGYRFSDRLAGREVLFGDHDTGPLQDALRSQFAGRTVSIEDIERFVLIETPYLKSHIKTKTLRPMQAAGLIEGVGQKRVGQYPPGTRLAFVA